MPGAAQESLEPVAQVALELHGLLVELQERKAHAVVNSDAAQRARQLAERMRQLAAEVGAVRPVLAALLARAGDRLQALELTREGAGNNHRAASWGVAKYYEGLARMLRNEPEVAVALPELKPRNYARNVFHVANGFFCGWLYTTWDSRKLMITIALLYVGWMGSLEIARRLNPRFNKYLVDKVFGAIARPSEAWRMNSATWFGIAVTIMLSLGLPRLACIAAVLTLGLGDPAAALIGKRWGRHRLWKRKSLEGSLGFLVVSFVAVSLWFAAFLPEVVAPGQGFGGALLAAMPLALVAGLAGAVTEALSDRLEDNLTITLAVAGAVSLVAATGSP